LYLTLYPLIRPKRKKKNLYPLPFVPWLPPETLPSQFHQSIANMNSGLSILFRRPHRILKIFSTMTTTSQIHTLQVVPINKIKTSNNNITFFRKQNMYSTLNPNTSLSDLIYLCYFLHECLDWKTPTYDLLIPVLYRITGSKSVETLI